MPNLWSDAMSFEQQVELRLNSLYLINRWVVLLHCALVVVSMFALGLPAIRQAPVAVIFGFFAFACFGFTEMLRTAISIFAINRNWRTLYASAVDPATRERFRAFIESYSGINDALFFIFYTAFTLGLICYGIAFLRTNASMSQLGILFTVWALLNLPAGSTPSLALNCWAAISNGWGQYFNRSREHGSGSGCGGMPGGRLLPWRKRRG